MCAFACAGAGDAGWGDETWVRVPDGEVMICLILRGMEWRVMAWHGHEMYSKTFARNRKGKGEGYAFWAFFWTLGVLWLGEATEMILL